MPPCKNLQFDPEACASQQLLFTLWSLPAGSVSLELCASQQTLFTLWSLPAGSVSLELCASQQTLFTLWPVPVDSISVEVCASQQIPFDFIGRRRRVLAGYCRIVRLTGRGIEVQNVVRIVYFISEGHHLFTDVVIEHRSVHSERRSIESHLNILAYLSINIF